MVAATRISKACARIDLVGKLLQLACNAQLCMPQACLALAGMHSCVRSLPGAAVGSLHGNALGGTTSQALRELYVAILQCQAKKAPPVTGSAHKATASQTSCAKDKHYFTHSSGPVRIAHEQLRSATISCTLLRQSL